MNKNEKFWKDAWAGKVKPESSNKFEEPYSSLNETAIHIPTIIEDINRRIGEDMMKNTEKIIKESLIKKGYAEITKVYVKKEEGNDWTYYFADEEGTLFICQIKEKFDISANFEGTKANMDLVYHNGPKPTNHYNF